jgi:hypothetical protein
MLRSLCQGLSIVLVTDSPLLILPSCFPSPIEKGSA